MLPTILFPCETFNPKKVDSHWQAEWNAVQSLGFEVGLVDHDALEAGDIKRAIRPLGSNFSNLNSGSAAWRGWMIGVKNYELLWNAMKERGVDLINTPDQYQLAHHLPDAYPYISKWSAPTSWLTVDLLDDPDKLQEVVSKFAGNPVVIKDWVKSQAEGYWEAACFIPNTHDLTRVRTVVDRFRDIQGSSLVGGVVFREFAELEQTGGKVEEWRVFALAGKPLTVYSRTLTGNVAPPLKMVADVAATLPSNFVTLDFAQRQGGEWLLLEVGDAQVSGLPNGIQPEDFWQAFKTRILEKENVQPFKI